MTMKATWAISFSLVSLFLFYFFLYFGSVVFSLWYKAKDRGKDGKGRQERPSDENDESKGMHGSGETACISFLIVAAELKI